MINFIRAYFFKGVGMSWVKKFFFVVLVRIDRVAQDKLFGVGMTLQ